MPTAIVGSIHPIADANDFTVCEQTDKPRLAISYYTFVT